MRTRAKYILVQHPREARNPVGTARMAHLSLEGSELLVGVELGSRQEFQRLFEQERARSVVLFPAPDARDVRELVGREPAPTVWVIDGTWWQAEKIWKRNPALRSLPAYRIEPRQPSQYQFRSEPAAHCVSTVEAIAELVETLEGIPGAYETMLAPFRALVSRQTGFASRPDRLPRRRTRARPERPFALPEPLGDRFERAVLFYAEGNGWPASMDPRPPTEPLQVMAFRPATGERLSAFVRPQSGLSPTALVHQGLSEAELSCAIEARELAERWRSFVRRDDVFCSWGHFSTSLLARAGISVHPAADLRPCCNRLLRAKTGRIEETHRRLGLAPVGASLPGRGGRRLAMLEAIWRRLVERAQTAKPLASIL